MLIMSVIQMYLQWLCFSVLPGVHVHLLFLYSFTGLWNVIHQFSLCLSNSGQALISSPDTCILSRAHLSSTHRLISVNQLPVGSRLCSETCETSPRSEGLSAESPSLCDLSPKSTISPQINQSCTAAQRLRGYYVEAEVEDTGMALK